LKFIEEILRDLLENKSSNNPISGR